VKPGRSRKNWIDTEKQDLKDISINNNNIIIIIRTFRLTWHKQKSY